MPNPPSEIVVVGKWHDLASEPIKQSFQKINASAINTAKEFDSLKRSIRASMAYTRDAIVKAFQESSKASEKHTGEMNRHLRFWDQGIGKIAGKIGSIRNLILVWMFALRPLINLVKDATQAMMEQEDAVKRLNFSLGIQGTLSEYTSEHLIKLSRAFQSTTRYGDELILQVFDKLTQAGTIMPSQFEEVTKAILDFASKTGRDPLAVAERFVVIAQGNALGLRRWGIAVDEATPKTRLLAEVIKYINEHMGGRAQKDIDSYAGRIAQMGNAFSDAKKSLGFFLVEVFKLDKAAIGLKEFFEALITKPEKIDILRDNLRKVNEEIINFERKRGDIFTFAQKKPFLGAGAGEIERAKSLIKERMTLITDITAEQNEITRKKELADQTASAEALKQRKLKAEADFLTAYNRLASRRLQIEKDTLQENHKEWVKYAGMRVEVEKWYKEESARINKAIAELNKKMYDEMTIFAQGATVAMRDTLVDGFFKVIKGEFEGLEDVISSFADTIIKLIIQISVTSSMMAMFPWTVPYLGGAHTGGYIYGKGKSYGMPKRFHSGGEVPAMLLEGEGVLNRNAMRNLGVENLNRLNRGEGLGQKQIINNYYIQTIDERSFTERLRQHPEVFAEGAEWGIRDNRSLRATSQRWG